MNIHLVEDEKFTDRFIDKFEKSQKNNIYILVRKSSNQELKYIKKNAGKIRIINTQKINKNYIISEFEGAKNLIIHYLMGEKVNFASKFIKELNVKVYWILFGSELYSYLEKKGVCELYDYSLNSNSKILDFKIWLYNIYFKLKKRHVSKKVLDNVLKNVDFFCFWNYFDYQLAIKYLPGNFEFNFFRYLMTDLSDLSKFWNNFPKELNIMVNNSSSLYGNHLTILKRLKQLNVNNGINQVLVPLSYGSEIHRNKICEFGSANLKPIFQPFTEFLGQSEYYKLISTCKIAIFGAKRQHAGNNIFFMLGIGAKVFLRPENNIFDYLKEKGFVVHDFNQLKSMKDLTELTEEEKNHNFILVKNEFNKEAESKAYGDFFMN